MVAFRDFSDEIRVSLTVEMITHQGDPAPCVCRGIAFEEGRGKGAAWVRYVCHHCAGPGKWEPVTGGDLAHRRVTVEATNHSQLCWLRPQSIARAARLMPE